MDAVGHRIVAHRAARSSPRQGILAYLSTVGPATSGKLALHLELPIRTVIVTLRDEEHYGTVQPGADRRWRFF